MRKLWFQVLCFVAIHQKGNLTTINGRGNVAENKLATQISTWIDNTGTWSAQNAVNGDKSCGQVTGRHYSATDSDINPWWKVDLGKLYDISAVIVYGREDRQDQLSGFQLYLTQEDPDPGNLNPSDLVYTALSSFISTVNITTPAFARYCLLRRPGNNIPITLCEVEVYGSECSKTRFGISCAQTCHCADNQSCYQGDGTLSCDSCAQGWMGNTCSNQCIAGRYGRNCELYCSTNCYDGVEQCNTETGQCRQGCNAGYMGFDCRTQCLAGRYGRNCELNCSTNCYDGVEQCNTETGQCRQGCNAGYMGFDCRAQCIAGRYGRNCESYCSTNCYDGVEQCNTETGQCRQGCNAGYMGFDCRTQCIAGRYGRNCELNCSTNCYDGVEQCNTETGQCRQGCNAGYMGFDCRSLCIAGRYGRNCESYCSTNCYDGVEQCNTETGQCRQGCNAGYMGFDCRSQCIAGRYGRNCESYCSTNCYDGVEQCNTETGQCRLGCNAGYMGFDCRTQCIAGRYGRNCESYCSTNCYDGVEQCNMETGQCRLGCNAGYMGFDCRRQCADGKYGERCSKFCHCDNDLACNKETGRCPNGCDIMWGGEQCSEYKGLNFSNQITTTQSGTYGSNYAHYAVDKVNNYEINTCKCCSVATTQRIAWWQIDLGRKYLIDALSLFGRSDNSNQWQIQSAAVFAGNQSLTWYPTSGLLIYTVPSSIGNQYHFVHQLNSTIIARYFIVGINRTVLTLCEFHLRNKVCSSGSFGEGCLHKCHCKDGAPCDTVRGYCPNYECDPGWKGDSCNTVCSDRTFGYGCNHTCHCSSCDPVYGTCHSQCDPGWRGSACSEACPFRTFGANCSITCNCFGNNGCNHENGTCGSHGCDTGWQGDTCSTECETPSFGSGCHQTCHCINNTPCHHINGRCFQNACEPGWKGYSCSQKCASPSFGFQCNQTCHCFNGTPCNHINGTCDRPECDKGWTGHACDKECSAGTFGAGCQSKCHCINGSNCHHINGTCERGICDPGWTGHACDRECVSPFFGLQCNQTCHCINGTPCNHISGVCEVPQCDEGWKSQACNEECVSPFFGFQCNQTCHCINGTPCNHISGVCEVPQCDKGWKGLACDEECSAGTFGVGCQSECHCINGSNCDHINGTCEIGLCNPGWTGHACDRECSAGTFGVGCQSECHCINGSNCDHINGTCERGLCNPGWTGHACDRNHPVGASSQNSSSLVVVAGVASIAGIFGLAIAVCIGLFLYRRQKSGLDEQQSTSPLSNLDGALRQQQTRQERVSENLTSTYTETSVNNLKGTEAKGEVRDGDEGGYYDFTKVVGIRIHELWDYIQEKTKNDCEQLFAEFKKLPGGLIYPCTAAEHIDNRGKTRYKQMYAYDHSRVILEEKNDKGTDYVNASYIDGFNKIRKFVASQGPTKEMIDDFWRMVWQLNTNTIVMLTNLVEQGATKCIQYWPPDEECSYGSVNVRVVQLDTDLDFDIRHLDVWREGESPRRIRQYHFKSWPDKDVPDSTWCLVKFWRAVETDVESSAGPIVVHCSAGIGRTGTFIALDNLVYQAREEGCVRPFQIVQTLREQRVNMVQTKLQYVYLHEVLADALSFGTQFVWSTQFEPMYMSLLQREDGEAKTRLEVQYDLIQKSLKDTESEQAEAPEYSNIKMVALESYAYQPKLKTRGSRCLQQLRATLIPNFSSRNTFLVAMSPDKSTMEEFWSLVDDLNIKTVVMLSEKSSSCYKTSCDLGAHDSSCQQFCVKRIEEKINKGHTERTFTFKQSQREEEDHVFTVKQFEYTAWKGGYVVPGDTQSFIDFLQAILAWQPHVTESQPVLICDRDGFTRCGIVCVALNEIQRIKIEGGHISIVQSVKTMKKRISKLIVNFEQFKFCYELVLAYLKTTEVYKNRLQSV